MKLEDATPHEIALCEFCQHFLTNQQMRDSSYMLEFFVDLPNKIEEGLLPTPYRPELLSVLIQFIQAKVVNRKIQ